MFFAAAGASADFATDVEIEVGFESGLTGSTGPGVGTGLMGAFLTGAGGGDAFFGFGSESNDCDTTKSRDVIFGEACCICSGVSICSDEASTANSMACTNFDADWNRELYGKTLTNREILSGSVEAPTSATSLQAELNRYSSRK